MERVVLLGENIDIENFREFEIVGIVSGKGNERMQNIPVFTYDYLLSLPKNLKVIIVDDHWQFEILCEFHMLMSKLGLHIGRNYIYHSMMGGKVDTNTIYKLSNYARENFFDLMGGIIGNKELVVLYGNCQIQVLIDMISRNREFAEKYVTCVIPRFWIKDDECEFKMLFESHILQMASYFFTQEVSVENRFGYMASTEYISSHLSKDCKIIMITNLYFEGYFPQLRNYGGEIDLWKGKFGSFGGYTDQEVLKLICMGKENEEILENISSVDYYSAEKVRSEIELELERFESREASVEIKMTDYLKEKYDVFSIFATVNHPTRNVLLELARRILERLEIYNIDIPYDESEIPQQMSNVFFPIYPSVSKILGLCERNYPFEAKICNDELLLLTGVDEDLDKFIAENNEKENEMFNVKLLLDFKKYMMIYIRVLRAAIHI